MRAHLAKLLAVFLLTAGLCAAAKRTETYSWPVGDQSLIRVKATYGTIVVERGEPGRVELILEATAKGDNAESWLEKLAVQGNPFGAGLAITVKQAGAGVEFTFRKAPERRLSLRLRVPEQCNLDLVADSGSITLAHGIKGNVNALVKHGMISAWRVTGPLQATTHSGGIFIEYASSDIKVRSHRGDLEIGIIDGWADLRADTGNIVVVNSRGGINAQAVRGNVIARLSGQIPLDSRLQATAGDVVVELDPSSSVSIEAYSSWGHVRSGLEWDIAAEKISKKRLIGQRNGGGVALALKAKGGNVTINQSARKPSRRLGLGESTPAMLADEPLASRVASR